MSTEEPKGSWYNRHKEAYNEKRRARYQADKEYRETIQKKARNAKRVKIAERQGAVERIWKGNPILCHRIGDVSKDIGVSVTVIRTWEKEGIIPRPIFGGSQRVYTQTQYNLLQELAEALSKADGHSEASQVKGQYRLYIKKHWMEGI